MFFVAVVLNKKMKQLSGEEFYKFGCKYIKILCTKQEYKFLFSVISLNYF